MTTQLWCWSDMVDPRLVETAMAEEERRARRKRTASNDADAAEDHDNHPVAA